MFRRERLGLEEYIWMSSAYEVFKAMSLKEITKKMSDVKSRMKRNKEKKQKRKSQCYRRKTRKVQVLYAK